MIEAAHALTVVAWTVLVVSWVIRWQYRREVKLHQGGPNMAIIQFQGGMSFMAMGMAIASILMRVNT